MNILVVFGLPASGKTYTAKLLEEKFDYFLYEADTSLPKDMDETLKAEKQISDDMRDRFFAEIIQRTKILLDFHEKIVVSQTFLKEKYRKQFITAFPDTTFILIETPLDLREKRLQKRKEYPLSLDYARKMSGLFDKVMIPHAVLVNNEEGEQRLEEQLEKLLH